MATTQVNRAHETTATIGTGTLTLTGAVNAYQTFTDAGVADTNTVRYLILDDGNAWEIGTGTYGVAGSVRTLARSVEESSNADALLDLTGNASVAVVFAAADALGPTSNPTFASVTTSDTAPYHEWVETDQTTDETRWRISGAGSNLRVIPLSDAGAGSNEYWQFKRTANSLTKLVGIGASTATITLDNVNGDIDATGTIEAAAYTKGGVALVSGGRVLITTLTASASAALEFTATDATKYMGYEFLISNLYPATDGVLAYFRMSTDGGTTYLSGPSGKDYLDMKYFDDIEVKYFEPKVDNYYSTLYNICK